MYDDRESTAVSAAPSRCLVLFGERKTDPNMPCEICLVGISQSRGSLRGWQPTDRPTGTTPIIGIDDDLGRL